LLSYGERAALPLDTSYPASHVDIAPTLLAELGVPRPDTWTGMALQQPRARDFLYFRERWETGLVDTRGTAAWKYWRDARTGREYAFDLSADPSERHNAIAAAPSQRRREWRLRVLATDSVGSLPMPGDLPGPHP